MEAELADGRILEFPDGTDPMVIQATVKKMIAGQQAPAPEQPSTFDQVTQPFVRAAKTAVYGIPEAAASMGTGALSSAVGGLYGMASAPFTGMSSASKAIQDLQNKFTYQPRSDSGKAIMGVAGMPQEGWTQLGSMAGKAVGNESLGEFAGSMVMPVVGAAAGLQGALRSGAESAATVASKQSALDILKAENAAKDAIRADAAKYKVYANADTGVKGAAVDMTRANQVLSTKNSINATRAIRTEDLGMPKGSNLGAETIDIMKERQYKAYENLVNESDLPQKYTIDSKIIDKNKVPFKRMVDGKGLGITDDLRNSVKTQVEKLQKEYDSNPELFKENLTSIKVLEKQLNNQLLDPQITLDAIKRLRNQAKMGLDSETMSLNETAATKLNLANYLEKVFEDNLRTHGKKGVVEDFRAARRILAKLNTLEYVVDESGLVNLRKLTQLKSKGAYMDGAMESLAKFGSAFEEAAMKPSSKGSLGFGDMALASAHGMYGNPLAAAGIIAGRGGIPMLAERGMLQGKVPTYQVGALNQALTYGGNAAVGAAPIAPFMPNRMLTGQQQ